MGVGGGGQKFLLNRLQAVGTHTAGNTCSGPMVMQLMPDMQASVRILVCSFSPPPAAAPKWPEWGPNRRPQGRRLAALPLGHRLDRGQRPPCCLGPHLPLTKNPNCVYLSDCLLAGSGTDGLTVNLSSRCTAEGNRIFNTTLPVHSCPDLLSQFKRIWQHGFLCMLSRWSCTNEHYQLFSLSDLPHIDGGGCVPFGMPRYGSVDHSCGLWRFALGPLAECVRLHVSVGPSLFELLCFALHLHRCTKLSVH